MSEVKEVEKKLNKALFEVKKKLQPVVKGAANPFFKSNYADLNSILESVEKLLIENKLILLQAIKTNGQFNIVESSISHIETSETVVSSCTIPSTIVDPQKLGSAVTYLRRYTLSALLGLQTTDDDGNLASKTPTKKSPTSKKKVATTDDF